MEFSNERQFFYSIEDLPLIKVNDDGEKRTALIDDVEECAVFLHDPFFLEYEPYPLYIPNSQTVWNLKDHVAPAESIVVLRDFILRRADFAIFSRARGKIFLSSIGAHRAVDDPVGSRVYGTYYQGIYRRLDTAKIPVIIANDGFHNFWHWHAQTMQGVERIRELGLQNRCVYVTPELNQWQLQCLLALGLERGDILEISEDVVIDRALYPSIVDPRAFLNLSPRYGELFKTVQRNLAIPRKATYTKDRLKLLYVSRRDAPHRTMKHERELILILKKFGFEEIIPSKMTYSEQVEAFSSADVVVGIHGAGLTNIGFCPNTALVIEIFDHQYMNYVYYKLARLVSCRYECILTSAHEKIEDKDFWAPDICVIVQDIFRSMSLNGFGSIFEDA